MRPWCTGQTNLDRCAFSWSCLSLERHRSARRAPGHDMVHLSQLAVAVAQHANVELVVFCCVADKCTFLDC
jgi:hypothetical protein